ncbi:MAG TPA: hypothetical protein VJ783_20025 [Pirellulales bacterium]|nr:hypothetical protein [Pirellulales bacterium]
MGKNKLDGCRRRRSRKSDYRAKLVTNGIALAFVQRFCDLDTGFQPKRPANIVKDEVQLDERQLVDWVAENGIDLMCVTCYAPGGV